MIKKVILSSLLCYYTLNAEVFTLSDAANEIVHTHPEVQEKLHNFKAAIESHNYSKTGFLPRVDFDFSLGSETTKSKTTKDEYETLLKRETSLKIVENLFNGYETTYDIKQQKEKYISASLSIIEKTNAIAALVSQTYLNILKYKSLLLLEQENLKNHELILNQIQEKVDSGFSPVSDALQVQTRHSLAKSNLQTNKNDLENEMTRFHKLLGRFTHINDFKDPSYNFSVPSKLENAIKFALKNNPSIKIANHNVQATKYGYKKTKNNNWPAIDAIVKIENNNNTSGLEDMTERYYAGISIKYNLYNGGADKINIQKNISMVQQENAVRDNTRRDVIQSVMLAFKTYQALIKKEPLLKEHLDFAKKTNSAYQEEFKIGNRTLLDVLNIEIELNNAQKENAINKYDMINAKFQLANHLGTLSNKIGISIDNIANLNYSKDNPTYKKDTLPLNLEADNDSILDMQDICDKSLGLGNVNRYGCKKSSSNGIDILQPIQTKKTQATQQTFSTQTPTNAPSNFMGDMIEEIPEAVPEAVAADLSFMKESAPINLEKDFIYFEYGSSKLTNNSKRLLDIIISKLQANSSLKLELTGYTDNRGPTRRNEIRSKSRAKNVKTYLISNGIARNKITTLGKGESNPIASNDTPEGRSINRRVEFKFLNNTSKIQKPRTQKESFLEKPVYENAPSRKQNFMKNNNNEKIEMIEVDF